MPRSEWPQGIVGCSGQRVKLNRFALPRGLSGNKLHS
jgi:hypothetical protein